MNIYRITYVLGTTGYTQSDPTPVLRDVKILAAKMRAIGAKVDIQVSMNGGQYWSRMNADELNKDSNHE